MSKPCLVRLAKGADLLAELARVAAEHEIQWGTVSVIGALVRAKTAFYHQDERRYEAHLWDEPLEILHGVGNISLRDGKPFVHLHLTLSRADGSAVGGHAEQGCEIFAAEAAITPQDGAPGVRVFDEPTGLFLWAPR